MADTKTRTDRFSNKAFGSCTCSAANTLTFAQIQMGVGLFEGKAMVIHQVMYSPSAASWRELVAATDRLTFALTTSNRLSGLWDISDPAMIDYHDIVGLAANTEPGMSPIVTDWTGLPGGGKLIPANPLWLAVNTAGAAAASNVRVELAFTFVELAPADYLELLQGLYPANIA